LTSHHLLDIFQAKGSACWDSLDDDRPQQGGAQPRMADVTVFINTPNIAQLISEFNDIAAN
jgi:hypothetical protein